MADGGESLFDPSRSVVTQRTSASRPEMATMGHGGTTGSVDEGFGLRDAELEVSGSGGLWVGDAQHPLP